MMSHNATLYNTMTQNGNDSTLLELYENGITDFKGWYGMVQWYIVSRTITALSLISVFGWLDVKYNCLTFEPSPMNHLTPFHLPVPLPSSDGSLLFALTLYQKFHAVPGNGVKMQANFSKLGHLFKMSQPFLVSEHSPFQYVPKTKGEYF